jgi:opacity protein-like surface antigen
MRRLLVALGLIGFVSPAFAADYALPTLRGSDTYVPAPPAYRWAGFYGGVQIGYSISQMDFGDGLGSMVGDILRNSTLARDVSNWTVLGHSSTARTPFGGFVGYNFQWDETVFGLEGNYNHVSLTRSLADSVSRTFIDNTGAPPNTTYQYNVTVSGSSSFQITDVATIRARAGWDAGQFLPYGFWGLALGSANVARTATVSGTRTDTTQQAVCVGLVCGTAPVTGPPTPLALPGPQTDAAAMVAYGYTAGLGIDVAFFSNAFARAEYEYIAFAATKGIVANINTFKIAAGIKF